MVRAVPFWESDTASSTANRPKSVVNLMTGFRATEDVSLKGSPTVSPITVAACSSRAFLLQFHFDDLLGVVPRAARVGHEDGLVQAEDGNRDQVADKEERFHESEGQGAEEDGQKDVEHAFLRVLGADLDDFLAVGNRGFLDAFQLDIGFDELHRAIGAGA